MDMIIIFVKIYNDDHNTGMIIMTSSDQKKINHHHQAPRPTNYSLRHLRSSYRSKSS